IECASSVGIRSASDESRGFSCASAIPLLIPTAADERQFCYGAARFSFSANNTHFRTGRKVIVLDIAKSNRSIQLGRKRRRSYAANSLSIRRENPGVSRNGLRVSQNNPGQFFRNVTAMLDAHDNFLADITALSETDGIIKIRFGHHIGLIHINAVTRKAR